MAELGVELISRLDWTKRQNKEVLLDDYGRSGSRFTALGSESLNSAQRRSNPSTGVLYVGLRVKVLGSGINIACCLDTAICSLPFCLTLIILLYVHNGFYAGACGLWATLCRPES
jgi:hypothetical protein